jgi:hypothetical protein
MPNKLNRIFNNVEQIIITSLLEGRYSHQLVRAVKTLSNELEVSLGRLGFSIDSLSLIDNYLNGLAEKEKIRIEIYLSITLL